MLGQVQSSPFKTLTLGLLYKYGSLSPCTWLFFIPTPLFSLAANNPSLPPHAVFFLPGSHDGQQGARLLPSHGTLLPGPHRSELGQGRASLPSSASLCPLCSTPLLSSSGSPRRSSSTPPWRRCSSSRLPPALLCPWPVNAQDPLPPSGRSTGQGASPGVDLHL